MNSYSFMIRRLLILLGICFFVNVAVAQTAENYFDDGLIKFKQKDYEGALLCYNKAIALNPKLGKAYNNRGVVKNMLRDTRGAMADFSQAIMLDSMAVSAYKNRGIARMSAEDYKGAIADFNKVLQLKPNDELIKNKIQVAQLLLDNSVKQSSSVVKAPENKVGNAIKDTVKIKVDTVIVKMPEKKAPEAIRDTIKIKKEVPVVKISAPLPLPVKDSSTVIKKPEIPAAKAVQVLVKDSIVAAPDTKVKELPRYVPDKIKSNQLLASGRLKAKALDYRGAMEDYTKAIETDSGNVQAYFARGLLKASLRDYNAVIETPNYDKSYKSKYDDANLKRELDGRVYGAIEDFSMAIKLDPTYADAYYNRALSLYYLQQYKTAILDFDRAIKINPYMADAFYYRGLVKGIQNDLSGACLDFIKASELGNAEATDLIKECQ